jgi:hypothetical protein
MDFDIPEELRRLQDTVRRFVRAELMPLEPLVLERENQGMAGEDLIPPEEEARLLTRAKEAAVVWACPKICPWSSSTDAFDLCAFLRDLRKFIGGLLPRLLKD